jgi:GR25 family glycosyltransferase involved in LPS biosynthesis
VKILGKIISLPSSQARRTQIRKEIDRYHLAADYSFFNAVDGKLNHQANSQLHPGEEGLWQSVLTLIEEIRELGAQFDYLHIMEDDAELSEQFLKWSNQERPPEGLANRIIFTDMFIEAALYAQLLPKAETLRIYSTQAWFDGRNYSGCTSSWLIPWKQLNHLYCVLSEHYQADPRSRLPLDQVLRQAIREQRLDSAVLFPFPTSVRLTSSSLSSIQRSAGQAVHATDLFNTILRRRLSYCSHPSDLNQIGSVLEVLLVDQQSIDAWLLLQTQHLSSSKRFRYRFDPRLLGLPDNPQADNFR